MAGRVRNEEFIKALLQETTNKMEGADSKTTFYLCMALGKGQIDPKLVKSDLYYTLYLTASRQLDEFDLFQISQISNFFCSNPATHYVPSDFWNVALANALSEAIERFSKWEGQLNIEVYISDFLKAFFTFGLKLVGGKSFLQKVDQFLRPNIHLMDP